jgi:hypothetical protein
MYYFLFLESFCAGNPLSLFISLSVSGVRWPFLIQKHHKFKIENVITVICQFQQNRTDLISQICPVVCWILAENAFGKYHIAYQLNAHASGQCRQNDVSHVTSWTRCILIIQYKSVDDFLVLNWSETTLYYNNIYSFAVGVFTYLYIPLGFNQKVDNNFIRIHVPDQLCKSLLPDDMCQIIQPTKLHPY